MHVYIDETGNTGKNMFDEEQPFFATLAIMYNGCFDTDYEKDFLNLALRLGKNGLHSREMTALEFDMACSGVYNIAGSTSKCNTRCLTISVFQKGCIGGFEPQALSWPPV